MSRKSHVYQPPQRPTTRLFRRTIEPLDVMVDVDLYNMVEEFHGNVRPDVIEPVLDLIESGAVDVDVVSLYHAITPDALEGLRDMMRWASGATPQHQRLCAASFLFMKERGLEPIMCHGGHGAYAGGWADVRSGDRQMFVECGTLRSDKLLRAMRASQTLMIVPYSLGCWFVNAEQKEAIVYTAGDSAGHDALGYIFRPLPAIRTPQPS